MASVLVTAREKMAAIITGLVPLDDEYPYLEASRHRPLEERPLGDSPYDNTRRFQTRLVPRYEDHEGNSLSGLGRGAIELAIQYNVPTRMDTGGFVHAFDLMASDIAYINAQLRNPAIPWNAGVVNVYPAGDPVVKQRDGARDTWIVVQEYTILFERDAVVLTGFFADDFFDPNFFDTYPV